ncbi:hypothetical protein [Labrys monachus]|uniref:Porin n=1 Tax=Labrys monachus TaxID=217067 RepID=A0ABU0FF95_9HYPH|nr:hypothetical protein [Labrys monachus]MDQ0392715.1 hypothetical protein [Labrys monachus]
MNSIYRMAAIYLIASAGLAASSSLSARADDNTASEIKLLKAQLNKLERKVDREAKASREIAARDARKAGSPAAAQAANQGATQARAASPNCLPGSFCYRGLTITPGGFFALEGFNRGRSLESDVASPWNSIPFGNNKIGHTEETRLSARQSRLSLLAQGQIDPATTLSGYGEFDFLGAAQTANSNESNSYNPRIRHLYAAWDQSDWGLHVLAGQTWSLTTLSPGMVPRQEQIPLTIDAQYVPGFTWARQAQIRVVKNFGPDLAVGFSAENAQTTFSGTAPAGAGVVATSLNGCGGSSSVNPSGASNFNACNAQSTNRVPDFVGKVSYDPVIDGRKLHFEAYGLLRDFYDRTDGVAGTGGNHDVFGGGVGFGVTAEVLPKLVDVQFSGLTGSGIGRYGTSGLPDVTYNANTGALMPISETQLLAGLIVHPLPTLDVYAYAGEEIARAKFTPGSASGFGFGNPASINSGCFDELSTATCVGNTKSVAQATIGLWDTLYKGNFGMMRAGLQYSFTERTGFAGVGGTPKADDNIVMTSLRYYPF